jgi:protein-S-isoprenylcysteine O-methyltransferase Ste14
LIARLFLIRGAPRGDRAGPPARAVAVLGTFIMGAVAVQPPTTHDWPVLALSDALLVGGLAFQNYAAASLGGSFAPAAEARDLVTSGAYRLVRHPIYLGELVAATGALLPVLTPLMTVIFAVFCLSQIGRVVLEERVLTAAFSQYREYCRRTPVLLPWPRPKSRARP